MHRPTLIARIVPVLLLVACHGSAIAAELLVPFDHQGKVNIYTPELERSLHLFPDYPNLIRAELYQLSENEFQVEIILQEPGGQARVKKLLSRAEVDAIRDAFDHFVTAPKGEVDSGKGRSQLLVGTSTLGLTYYGWALPLSLSVTNSSSAVALYMLISAGSFYLPYIATDDYPVTDAMSRLALYGGTRGIIHGVNLRFASGIDTRFSNFGFSVVLSFGELFYGLRWAERDGLSLSEVETIAMMGDLGLLWGWGVTSATLLGGPAGSAFTLMLSGVGIATAVPIQHYFDLSVGDVRNSQALGALGSLYPLTLLLIANDGELTIREAAGSLVTGSLVGIGAGLLNGPKIHLTETSGNLVLLSTAMGGLTGAGIVYAVLPDGKKATPYLIGATVGGTLGYSAMYKARLKRDDSSRSGVTLGLQMNPAGLFTLDNRGVRPEHPTLPLATLSLRF